MADLTELEQSLGITFDNPALLKLALTHSSYINENPASSTQSNERLEFLGDAVLGMVVAEKLYQDFPEYDEGRMTKIRSSLVRQGSLLQMAKLISLGNYIQLGKGEEKSGGRRKAANLACAMEAVIAAIFLDKGLDTTRQVILRLFEKGAADWINIDYKSRLQELIQAKTQQLPAYRLLQTTGPSHNHTFTVEVRLGEQVLGTGSGQSKKAAQTEAARQALENLPAAFTV